MEEVRDHLLAKELCKEAVVRGDKVDTEKGQVFVKFGTGGAAAGLKELEYEYLCLERLCAPGHLRVPKPWAVGGSRRGNYIAMEYIPLTGKGGSVQRQLGTGLAQLHLTPAEHPTFGFPLDGCCGAAPQPNNTECRPMNCVEFWREFRLGSQLQQAAENYPGDRELQERGAQLSKHLPELFSMLVVEDIKPSLLHGDLWSGNFGGDDTGRACIFDPAAYYGHDEADLGIARMFGGFGPQFWDAYHEVIPKRPGYEKRALLYELHHHLNHYNIFGSGYRSGALSLMGQLLK